MPTVLVVDDSPVDRRLAAGLLSRAGGWAVEQAVDGEDALRQVEAAPPDLVVTDMTMPRKNGLELVAAMRAGFRHIPVILMTAQGSEEIAVEALQLGAASYVPKRKLAMDLVETAQHVVGAAQNMKAQARLGERLEHVDCQFILGTDVSELLQLPNVLQQIARAAGVCDDGDNVRLCVALEEALLNALFHGSLELPIELRARDLQEFYRLADERRTTQPYADRKIYVTARFVRNEAQFVIRDEGPGFDVARITNPADPANFDRPTGRGLMLIHTFMNEVRHNERGNEITLLKRHAC